MNEEERYLSNYDITQYDRPSIAADIVLFTLDNRKKSRKVDLGPLQVLLIQRAAYPEKDQWALPGGFCRPDETIEETAKRELLEETNVSNAYLRESKTFSNTKRDKRGWIISDAFIGIINKKDCNLRADSDAWDAKWFDVDLKEETNHHIEQVGSSQLKTTHTIYKLALSSGEENLTATVEYTKTFDRIRTSHEWNIIDSSLAFDHANIIVNLLMNLRSKINDDIKVVFELLPEYFTIGEVEAAYKAIFQYNDRVPNFRRTILPYVEETMIIDSKTCRPAKVFQRKLEMF